MELRQDLIRSYQGRVTLKMIGDAISLLKIWVEEEETTMHYDDVQEGLIQED